MGEVVSRADLQTRVADARRAGQTIAFANGCFDLLHVGHVRYLAAAAQEADLLIVAINDDPSVRALKGEGRPILPAADRAELVAALRFVDLVVVFPEATVGPLLEAVRPDVHCKGTDYTLDSVSNATSSAPTAGASPSSGIPRITRPAICWRASPKRPGEPSISARPSPGRWAT